MYEKGLIGFVGIDKEKTFFDKHNRKKILLADGLYLTEFGHDLIYKELCKYKMKVLEIINQSSYLDKELIQ